MNIQNNINAMNAANELLSNSAHNIANVNTENFERLDTSIVDENNTVVAKVGFQSESDLVQEMVNQKLAKNMFELNAKVVTTNDEMMQTVMDIKEGQSK